MAASLWLHEMSRWNIFAGSDELLQKIARLKRSTREDAVEHNAWCDSQAAPCDWYMGEDLTAHEGEMVLLAREQLLARGKVSGRDPERNEDWVL